MPDGPSKPRYFRRRTIGSYVRWACVVVSIALGVLWGRSFFCDDSVGIERVNRLDHAVQYWATSYMGSIGLRYDESEYPPGTMSAWATACKRYSANPVPGLTAPGVTTDAKSRTVLARERDFVRRKFGQFGIFTRFQVSYWDTGARYSPARSLPDGTAITGSIVSRDVWFPHWLPALVLLLPLLWRMIVPRWIRRRRSRAGRCARCGFDLRATPDFCPECGSGKEKLKGTG
jgi:hypothetical protein